MHGSFLIMSMTPQDKIYYIVCPTRDIAENSPYMEALLQKGIEVLYCYEPFDDVVFNNVRKYKGRQFVSVETNQVSPANCDPPIV